MVPATARLVNWSTLMVRVSEGYSLTFTAGNTGTPIHEGDTITNSSGTKSARVVMTPILTAGSWAANNAAGTLVLANIYPSDGLNNFASGDALCVNSVQLATAGTYTAIKKNYIRVYYTQPTAQGTEPGTVVETDNIRLSNPVGTANWPSDDLTGLTASNDYVTLVQWTGTNGLTASSTPAAIMTSTSEPGAIIVTSDLVSPSPACMSANPFSCNNNTSFAGPDGSSAGDNIGLITGYSSGTSTYYDDFAAQLDLKSGTGFLTPMQQ